MFQSSSAARRIERPAESGEGEGRTATRRPCRAFAVAGLAFHFPLLSLSPQTAPPPPADTEPAIGLTPPEVPAAGDQESILAIDRFGRYAVEVGNDQGSSLELVDRMAGTLGRSGTVGRESGRLDLFLDRGRYKLRIASSARGRGKAKLAAHAFHEKRPAGTPPPLLVETRLIEETLGDYQQLSWWLDVREGRQETDRREVRLEAAGRNL